MNDLELAEQIIGESVDIIQEREEAEITEFQNTQQSEISEKPQTPEIVDTDEFIYCRICFRKLRNISRHIKSHELTFDEYRERYPDAPIVAENSRKKMSKGLLTSEVFQGRGKEARVVETDVFGQIKTEREEIKIPEIDLSNQKISFLDKQNKNQEIGSKNDIIDFLKSLFPNKSIENNYLIEKVGLDGQLEYSFVSDISIPSLKIAFYFPETFWHNRVAVSISVRNRKLENDKWKIVTIKGNDPQFSEIQNSLRGFL